MVPKLDIRAMTWNMGNKKVAEDDVASFAAFMKGADVIAISTQEEKASKKNQLHNKLLEELNNNNVSKKKVPIGLLNY